MPDNEISGIVTEAAKIRSFISVPDLPEEDWQKSQVWEKCFSKWKYKLRLGNEVYISTDEAPRKLKKSEFVTIKPGDFALLITKEKVRLGNDVMGFISMRFDYKQKGLINVSGFHVDPLYQGKLIFSAFNAGPRDIVIRQGDPVFMIFFQKLPNPCNSDKKDEGYDYIPADLVEQIRGTSTTLSSNASRLDKLEFYSKIIGGLTITILTLLIGLALREFIKGG